MLYSAWVLMMSSAFLMLRLSPSGSFPKPLTLEEEQEALQQWKEGVLDARNRLIEHNLRLVAHITKKYYAQCDDLDDLISIGTIGLIKAINTYDSDKKVKLATYASRCIENEILMYLRSTRRRAAEISLSDAMDTDEEGSGLSLLDVIASEDDLDSHITRMETIRQVQNAVDSALDRREKRVIEMRYGLKGNAPRTQRETAEALGISRSYISRIEKKALEKLRNALNE